VPATTEPKAIEVSAVRLYAAYQSNELAADQKYKGHLLKMTGIALHVGRDISGSPFISIAADAYGISSVDAYFSSDNPADLAKIRKIRRGMTITLTCLGSGLNLTNPTLDCRR